MRSTVTIVSAMALCIACGRVRYGTDDTPLDPGSGTAGPSVDASADDAGTVRPNDGGRRNDGGYRQDGGPRYDAATGEITVEGRIVDVRGRAVSGWSVAIGNRVSKTDGEGRFVFERVATPYDVAFASPGIPLSLVNPQVWIYGGLSRPDPTLQTDFVFGQRESNVILNPVNAPVPPQVDGGRRVAMASVTTGFLETATKSGADPHGTFSRDFQWMGPETIDGTLHLLSWIQSEESTNGLSLDYVAYREQPFRARSGEHQSVTLDQSPTVVPTSSYSAQVTSSWVAEDSGSRGVGGMIAFESGGRMHVPLLGFESSDGQAELLVPTLPRSRVFLRAAQGGGFGTGAKRSGSVCRPAVPTAPTVLVIPEPRTLAEPAWWTKDVDESTSFTWSSGPHVSTFTVYCAGAGVTFNRVGLQDGARFPTAAALGMDLPRGMECTWSVAVHGEHLSVDDATGPNGMLTACDDYTNAALLPEGGTFTRSDWHWFYTTR